MLENCKNAKERWGGVSSIIDRWLQERQQLLVEYYALSTMEDEPENAEPRSDKLRNLCQLLVDYVSAGHFEVYDRLVQEGREFDDKEGLEQVSHLFATVDETTGTALDFNDKYLETDDLDSINEDLSHLGEALETRFAAEDRMIQILHTAHQDMVGSH